MKHYAKDSIAITRTPLNDGLRRLLVICLFGIIFPTIALGGHNDNVCAPTFSGNAGTYYNVQNVVVNCSTPGATIRYTVDGSNPTDVSQEIASGSTVIVDHPLTLKAKAFMAGHSSQVTVAHYNVILDFVPQLSVPSGRYTTWQTVTVTDSVSRVAIHYTTDGSDPTELSPAVSSGGNILVDRTMTLKVTAFWANGHKSSSTRADYLITGALAIGGYHTLALKSDGTVWACGFNSHGQLGDGTKTNRAARVQVAGLSDVVAVAAGGFHSLALKRDGTVWAWGRNAEYQLGDGMWAEQRLSPVQVFGLTNVTAIVAGYDFSMALKSDGSVWGWGKNWNAQLGDGTETNAATPVCALTLTDIVSLAAGYNTSVAVKRDGTVWISGGLNQYYSNYSHLQVLGLPRAIKAAVGMYHVLILNNDGTVCAWGRNIEGQLGDKAPYGRDVYNPLQIPGLTGVVAVAAGDYHSVALKSDGTACAWGAGWFGQLGDGASVNRTRPAPIITRGQAVQSIVAGKYNSMILRQNGTFMGWGNNDSGQLGDGVVTNVCPPMQALGMCDVATIATRQNHTLALKHDGTVWAWGDNSYGQLGDGGIGMRLLPIQTQGLSNVSGIATGYDQSLAVKKDGTVWAWGANWCGELGTGTDMDSATPVQVSGLTDCVKVVAGDCFSFAIQQNGTVWGWGYNGDGELGDGMFDWASYVPVQVSGLSHVVAMAAGCSHVVALKSDGTVWAWGNNYFGQLGNGTTIQRSTPTQVMGVSDIIAVATGENHSMALRRDGTVWVWGNNRHGQLGDGTTVNRQTPVMLSGLTGVLSIAGGSDIDDAVCHSMALKNDGTVWAWGSNANGQLGDGTTTDQLSPVQVVNRVQCLAIFGGGYHSYALKNDGTMVGWGRNRLGQLTNRVILTGALSACRITLDPADTNQNAISDAWEMQHFGNLTTAATEDHDGDGLTNVQEYFIGTNPTVADP